jgi:hypothetical protein
VPGIFISYRGEDSEMAVGRLADGLRPHFGKDQVFVDVVTLRGGEEWAEKIRQAVDFAQVVLVLIGRSWLTAQDARGRRRLDDPSDRLGWVADQTKSSARGWGLRSWR